MVSLQALVTELMQWSGQPAESARGMTASDAKAHFDSEAFDNWRKWRDNQSDLMRGVCERLDVLIKAPRR